MTSPAEVKPRFIAGSVMPADADRLPHPQPQPLLPPDIRRVSSALNISDYTNDGVNEAVEKRYWPCVDELVRQGAQSICLAGFPIASQLGRDRVLDLQEKTKARPAGERKPRPKRRSARRVTWAPRASRSRVAGRTN